MKKILTRTLILFLAICMLMGAGALAACGEDAGGVVYTATVTREDGAPVQGVKVMWDSYGPYTTGQDGVATAELPEGTYTVTVDAATLPEGCADPGKYTVTARVPKTSIILSSAEEDNTVLYTVTVLYPDGTPAEGVITGLCLSASENGTCSFLPGTDGSGQASIRLAPAVYNVQIPAPPAGYTYPKDEHNYYTEAQATPEHTSVTITLVAE